MAFFKFPWPGQKAQDDKPAKRSRAPQAESIEAMRRRARHRLIGAAVLVLVGVVGFPLLFDTQPRPIPVDIPIVIPDRNKAAPLVMPGSTAPVQAPAQAAPPPVATAPGVAGGLADGEEVVASARSAAKPAAPVAAPAVPAQTAVTKSEPHPEPKPVAKAETKPKPEPKPERKPEPKPEPKEPKPAPARTDDAARARALLEGRSLEAQSPAKAEDGRFIVQVGAFAETEKAREVRGKLERAGLKTYAQVVDTKDGKRTRVRVGPFSNRAEADKAAARIKGLDLPASVLTL